MKKIGLIGIGKMGVSHLAIANQTPGVQVEAICDTSKPLMRLVEKNTSFKGFTDYKKMLNETNLDGVLVLVPNSFHFEIVKKCVERGIHVFVEKPLTLSYMESKYLVDLAETKGVKGQVGYVNRFNPIFERVKRLLAQNVIGEIFTYTNTMKGGVMLKKNAKGWRNDYSKGGGCLFDYGPHCFDLSTYFFGTDARVQTSTLKKIYSTDVDDIVYCTLLHNNKIIGINCINWSDSSVRKATNSIEIYGSRGKITANKQELSIYLTEENSELKFEKGWNQLYVTDENTEVPYYLRGEDFSKQMMEFSALLNGEIKESRSSFFSASITDRILEETKALSKEIL